MRTTLLLSLCAMLVLLSCKENKSVNPGGKYSISGVVSENGLGIAGIVVSDGVRSGVTDDLGRYQIDEVPTGTWTIRPMTIGYRYSPDSLKLTVSGSNLTNNNFTAKQITFADFTRCKFEIHGVVFELKNADNTVTKYDTTDIVFSAKRNLSDMTVLLFDTVVTNPDAGWFDKEWVKKTSILLRMTAFDRVNAVEYHDLYRAESTKDWGLVSHDSTNISLGRIVSTGKWTYSVTGSAFLPSLFTKAESGNYDYDPMHPSTGWKSSSFTLFPTAWVRITLAL